MDYSCEAGAGVTSLNSQGGTVVTRMGIAKGDLVLELGYDPSDCDEDLRTAIETHSGSSLLDEESQEVVDSVILWWRDEDGDLVDALMDALTYLSDEGDVWVLNPKVGKPGHIEPADIQDAAPIAGLTQTLTFSATPEWSATRLVPRKSKK